MFELFSFFLLRCLSHSVVLTFFQMPQIAFYIEMFYIWVMVPDLGLILPAVIDFKVTMVHVFEDYEEYNWFRYDAAEPDDYYTMKMKSLS